MVGCVGYNFQPAAKRIGTPEIYIVIGASNALNYLQALPRAFDTAMTAKTGNKTFVLNCAKGGSGLNDWAQGSYWYNKCLYLYQMQYSYKGTLKGILFVNGEYEGLMGTEWTTPFATIVQALRNDLGNPVLPIAYLQLSQNMTGEYVESVRLQQAGTLSIPYTCMVNPENIALENAWHYTNASLTALGKKFADCFN